MNAALNVSDYQTAHLFLLVGRNPIPNYLAAELLLKPGGQLYLVYSLRTEQTANHLARYWNEAHKGCSPRLLMVDEMGGTGTYVQIQNVLDHILRQPHAPERSVGLHYTGGTKAMALHAYRAVLDNWKAPAPPAVFSYLDASFHVMHITCGNVSGFTQNLLLSVKPNLNEVVRLHALDLQKPITTTPAHASLADELRKAYCDNNKHQNKTGREVWRTFCNDTFRDGGEGLKKPEALVSTVFQFPSHPTLATFVTRFRQEVVPDGQTLGKAANGAGFADAQALVEWLDGKWLEHYMHWVVQDIQRDTNLGCKIHDCGLSIEPKPDINHPNFEVDIGVMQGYRLYAISCYTGAWRDMAKLKLFEAYERARNMGGDETFAGLVYFGDDSAKLEKRIMLDWNPEGQIRVFGIREMRNLRPSLVDWFKRGLAETKRVS